MNPRENIHGLGKHFAHRLGAMIEARLVTHREYMPWADSVILSLEHPPLWILDLTITKYLGDAIKAVNGFAHADPFEPLSTDTWVDDYVASLYLRYERRELSWASLLEMAGLKADGNGGRKSCEYFFLLLTAYEQANFAESVELRQRSRIVAEYADLIDSVRRVFECLRTYRTKQQ